MNNIWSSKGWKAIALLPISAVFYVLQAVRSWLYKTNALRKHVSPVPVIVVGNISVGGTGKTPMVIALVKALEQAGLQAGVVSRGYAGEAQSQPLLLSEDTPVSVVGDEPWLIYRETRVAVCVCVNRAAAVAYLHEHTAVDVIISDDGMQHYAMGRNVEIAVVDAQRGVGNGWLLPAGCLREPIKRLCTVDLIALQTTPANASVTIQKTPGLQALSVQPLPPSGTFCLAQTQLVNLADQSVHDLSEFATKQVHAVAGLGYPARFFALLRSAGVEVTEHPLPDHHAFIASDVQFNDELPVLVTSKDAVKLSKLDADLKSVYEVQVSAVFDPFLQQAIASLITGLKEAE